MALQTNVPWIDVSPQSFVQAGTAGAEAGLGAARTALEARSISDRAAQAAEALSSHERIQAMEMQARREIAEQNRLREDQQLAIENAYRTAQIGLGKDRIAEQQALAEAKAKQAAAQFASTQGFAKHLAAGGSVAEAMSLFPMTPPSDVNALRLSKEAEPGQAKATTIPGAGNRLFVINPKTGHATPLPPEGLTEGQKLAAQRENERRTFTINQDIKKLQREKAALGMLPGKMRKTQEDLIDSQIKSYQDDLKKLGPTTTKYAWDAASGSIKPVDLAAEPSHDEEP